MCFKSSNFHQNFYFSRFIKLLNKFICNQFLHSTHKLRCLYIFRMPIVIKNL